MNVRALVSLPDGYYDLFTDLPSEWFHVTLVLNGAGDGIKFYTDGIESASGTELTGQPGYQGNNGLVAGRFYVTVSDRYADVEVDELKFWNRELASDEVLSLYEEYN